jgi:hypothetical protein
MDDPKKWVITWYDGNDTRASLIEGVSPHDLGDHITLTAERRGFDPTDDVHSVVEIASKNALVYTNDGVAQLAYNLESF